MGILKKNNQLEKYSPMWSASMSRPTWLLSDESPDRPDWCWLVLAAVTGSWRRLMFSAPSRVFMNLNTKISSSLTFSANGRETRGARTTGARGARSKQSVQQFGGNSRNMWLCPLCIQTYLESGKTYIRSTRSKSWSERQRKIKNG